VLTFQLAFRSTRARTTASGLASMTRSSVYRAQKGGADTAPIGEPCLPVRTDNHSQLLSWVARARYTCSCLQQVYRLIAPTFPRKTNQIPADFFYGG
jgi:hypothetical protein